MSAQKASAAVRFVRLAAAVVFLALAAVVVARLAGRRGDRIAPPAPTPPGARTVDLKTNIVHEEYKEGRLVAVVRGEIFSLGPDGRNRLRGAVDVTNYGPSGEVTSRLTADEVSYAKDTLVFEILGRVRIEAGGMTLEGDAFEYDKAAGLFHAAAGGRFDSRTIGGRAGEIAYAENAGEIRLGGGFDARLAARDGPDKVLGLSGRSLRYDRRERRGRIEGRAVVQGPDFRGASGAVSFVAAADEAGLVSAMFEDGPEIELGGRVLAETGRGKIRAARIAADFSRSPARFEIETSGGTALALRSAAGRSEAVIAEAARLEFSRDDECWTWFASGGVRIDLAETGRSGRVLEGEEATADGAGLLRVSGAIGRPAVADSVEARIEAPALAVSTESGGLLATGGLTCLLKPGNGGRRIGFFQAGEDVRISCGSLETRPETGATRLLGNVLIQQGMNSIRGGEIELADDAGRMSGKGGVAITLAESGSEGRPDRMVELAGQDMTFRPDTRTLALTTKTAIRLPEARLEAGAMSAFVARDGRTIESLEAKPDVIVTRGRFSGRSDAASYDASAGRIELTGRAVLTDGKGGSARGAKLTFDLADDKILIENEGPGRATTVVRS
jgi:lipopolysaccharide export system protein LptA